MDEWMLCFRTIPIKSYLPSELTKLIRIIARQLTDEDERTLWVSVRIHELDQTDHAVPPGFYFWRTGAILSVFVFILQG